MYTPTHYFLFGLVFFGVLAFAAVLGRGVFGFLVGTLSNFLAVDGDFLALAGEARFFSSAAFTAAFFGDFAFVAFDGVCFFSFGADEAPRRPRAGAVDAAVFLAFAGANLKDPGAPFPFVCTSSPVATAAFKYFLRDGDIFSESTSLFAAAYFFIARSEDPPPSFKFLMALPTISDVRGRTAFARGFFAEDFVFGAT
jgi:hypothetical protein